MATARSAANRGKRTTRSATTARKRGGLVERSPRGKETGLAGVLLLVRLGLKTTARRFSRPPKRSSCFGGFRGAGSGFDRSCSHALRWYSADSGVPGSGRPSACPGQVSPGLSPSFGSRCPSRIADIVRLGGSGTEPLLDPTRGGIDFTEMARSKTILAGPGSWEKR